MNCKQANENIQMREILESFSLFPSKENPKTAYYFALDREERTPSLMVNFIKNIAYDFGTGKTYDNISIVQAVKRCSISEALEYLKRFDFSFQKQEKGVIDWNEKIQYQDKNEVQPHYQITEIKEVSHPALMDYLKSRKLESQKDELKEIHYELNGKHYFGLGFMNDSRGYEIRNSIVKICLGKKDITTIKNHSETENQFQNLKIFEGFTDYLSFKILEKSLKKASSDYLILNSVSMVNKASELLQNYNSVELYLDNDRSGDGAIEQLSKIFPEAEDCRLLYKNSKDLNEFLVSSSKNQTAERHERKPQYSYKIKR